MTVAATFAVRREELRRRVEALPREVQSWKDRTVQEVDANLHFSQLQAISILIGTFSDQQQELLNQLDPQGNATGFEDAAFALVGNIIRAQRVWDFFRDKLDLRFSPLFKEVLWVSDTIAWDCYRPVLDTAAGANILSPSAMREPPLTYLTAEFSPATWVRGTRPNDGREYHLGTALLPIPVIELPWDHIENTWEFLSLHHEVGHDIEADLGLRVPLRQQLQNALQGQGVPADRIKLWSDWLGEIFADLVGLQLGGPAFAESLMHLLLLPAAQVTTFDPEDPHPTHYPRILMNTAYAATLLPNNQAVADHARAIADRWIGIYGQQPQFTDVIGDFPTVFSALMDTPLAELKGKSVRDLMPYSAADDGRIRGAVEYMLTGQNKPNQLKPRHAPSAARLAVTEAAVTNQLSSQVLDDINKRAMQLVRDNAPGGLRAGDGSARHRKFIAGFVDRM